VFNYSLEYAGRYSFFAQTIQLGYDARLSVVRVLGTQAA